jgi:hypothetical protein
MKNITNLFKWSVPVALIVLTACTSPANKGMDQESDTMNAPFGSAADVAYAEKLWGAMQKLQLVGNGRMVSTPYTGSHPHGAILDTLDGTLSVAGDRGAVIVKNNYGGEGVSKKAVADNPEKYLKAVTVMFKRAGYDADNKDWFWVKYAPDGSVMKNPKKMSLAGRVAKGMPKGCIACHKAAPGGDMVFNHDKLAR